MGYFWLNSNSKLRATLSPQFESLTKSCEQAEVDMVQGWERDVYLSGFMHAYWCLQWSEYAIIVILPEQTALAPEHCDPHHYQQRSQQSNKSS